MSVYTVWLARGVLPAAANREPRRSSRLVLPALGRSSASWTICVTSSAWRATPLLLAAAPHACSTQQQPVRRSNRVRCRPSAQPSPPKPGSPGDLSATTAGITMKRRWCPVKASRSSRKRWGFSLSADAQASGPVRYRLRMIRGEGERDGAAPVVARDSEPCESQGAHSAARRRRPRPSACRSRWRAGSYRPDRAGPAPRGCTRHAAL